MLALSRMSRDSPRDASGLSNQIELGSRSNSGRGRDSVKRTGHCLSTYRTHTIIARPAATFNGFRCTGDR